MTRENLHYCKDHSIRITGPELGRPYKPTEENKQLLRELRKQKHIDEGIRSNVESKFGVEKRSHTRGFIRTKLRKTSETSIMIVFSMINLERILNERLRLFLSLYEP